MPFAKLIPFPIGYIIKENEKITETYTYSIDDINIRLTYDCINDTKNVYAEYIYKLKNNTLIIAFKSMDFSGILCGVYGFYKRIN
ncbi:MAG: hypothetical protein LBP63_03415 [Prevotellaceae bacterium]|jgi:hypothetical protein|nr:hypothetical protein [Prevotellaceae bacterium]